MAETRQARSALHLSGVPPWELIPDVRPALESVRVPGSVAEGAELAALVPVLDAAARLRAYGRGIADGASDLHAAFTALPHEQGLRDLVRPPLAQQGRPPAAARARLR